MQIDQWEGVNAIGFAAIGAFLLSWLFAMAIILPAALQKRMLPRPIILVVMCAAMLGIGALFIGATFGGLPTK